jgi:hypothetical protein
VRRLLIAGGVALGALLLADRITAVLAAKAVSSQLRSSGDLREQPDVSIRGFPFLTQAVSGRYDRVDLTAHDIRRRALTLSRLDVVVRGARVPLRSVLGGKVSSVPVESITASGTIPFPDLAQDTGLPEASIEPAEDGVRVTARLAVLGQDLVVTADCSVELVRGGLRLSPKSVSAQREVDQAVADSVRDRFRLEISIGTLPYGVRLTGIEIRDDGLVLKGRTGPTVLQRP